jgi:hypothetical protein
MEIFVCTPEHSMFAHKLFQRKDIFYGMWKKIKKKVTQIAVLLRRNLSFLQRPQKIYFPHETL